MKKINMARWLSFIINGLALIYLNSIGVTFWKAFVLLFIVLMVNYMDGLHRGRNSNAT